MATRLDIRTGVTGYRDQLERARRFFDRLTKHHPYVVDYQDDVFAFFQNCWHLKDWVRNDPLVPQDKKDRIKQAVESSPRLAICSDMANGTKHLDLHKPRAAAAHSHVQIPMGGENRSIDCMIEVAGSLRAARLVAQECIDEWVRILGAEGLPTEPQ